MEIRDTLRKGRTIYQLFGRSARARLHGLICFTVLAAVLEAIGAAAIVPFVALLNDSTYLSTHAVLVQIYTWSGLRSEREFMVVFAAMLLCFYLLKNSYHAYLNHRLFRFVYTQMECFSRRLFGHYMRLPLEFHLRTNSAELIRDVSNEVFTFFTHVLTGCLILVSELFVMTAIFLMLVFLEPGITLGAAALLASLGGGFLLVVRPKVLRYGRIQQEENAQRLKCIRQGFGAIKEIKVLGREHYFISRFDVHEHRFAVAARFAMVLNQTPRLFIETVAYAAICLGVGLAFALGDDPGSMLPTLALFAVAAVRLLPSANRIAMSLSRVLFYYPTVEVLRRSYEESLAPFDSQTSRHTAVPVWRFIVLDSVSYTYPNAGFPAVNNLNLKVPRGARVALLGESGSGKTTVVDLIAGVLSPQQGRVLLDDSDDPEVLGAWRRRIGYIPQVIFILDDTIRRNVAFGVPDEEIDDARVWRALELAKLKTHVAGLVNGLDSMLGENGTSFSGGQRQRIGIARALYQNPEVLIMDEATSALDEETERGISETLDSLPDDLTVIAIAHRPETIRRCNMRVRLSRGSLVI